MARQPVTYDELAATLRQLANRWTLKARDHNRESKTKSAAGDVQIASYHRGIAETYHRAALELAALLKGDTAALADAVAAAAATSADAPPAAPKVTYADISIGEVMRTLDYAGVSPRDVNKHDDNVFTAIFSRWQPFSEAERIDKIKSADNRILILNSGKLRDTSDPYVEFAFKP